MDDQTFEAYLQNQDLASHTVRGYSADLASFAVWFAQANDRLFTPEALTLQDACAYRSALLRQKKSAATINRRLAALRAYALYAQQIGALNANPLVNLKLIERVKPTPQWLDRRAQSALLREAERALNVAITPAAKRQALRDQTILVLLLNTGLRVAELCALDWVDVTLLKGSGSLTVLGKGNKTRTVPLNEEARTALRAWAQLHPRQAATPLFSGKRMERLERLGVQRMVAELARRAKLEAVTPHTLRHTFAKNLVNAGVTLEKVATLLGHSNLNTTRIYIEPDAHDLAQAVAQIGS